SAVWSDRLHDAVAMRLEFAQQHRNGFGSMRLNVVQQYNAGMLRFQQRQGMFDQIVRCLRPPVFRVDVDAPQHQLALEQKVLQLRGYLQIRRAEERRYAHLRTE